MQCSSDTHVKVQDAKLQFFFSLSLFLSAEKNAVFAETCHLLRGCWKQSGLLHLICVYGL